MPKKYPRFSDWERCFKRAQCACGEMENLLFRFIQYNYFRGDDEIDMYICQKCLKAWQTEIRIHYISCMQVNKLINLERRSNG